MTPTPAEPRNSAVPLKSLFGDTEPEAEAQAGEEAPQAVEVETESKSENKQPEKDKSEMDSLMNKDEYDKFAKESS